MFSVPNGVNRTGLVSAADYADAIVACHERSVSVQGLRNDLTFSLFALAAYDDHRRWTPQQLGHAEALAEHVLAVIRQIRYEEAYGGRYGN